MASQYDELEKLFTGTWHTDRDENMEAFVDAAGSFYHCFRRYIYILDSYNVSLHHILIQALGILKFEQQDMPLRKNKQLKTAIHIASLLQRPEKTALKPLFIY